MKRTTFTLLLAVVALAPLAVFAQESFVPLTSLPAVQDFQESRSLTDFLNNLYKICIGVAAALAVFQIMHGGLKFMTNKGSISENEQAKSLIQGAVLGLVLVLSPIIVFGIINPKILELNFDTSKLGSEFSGVQPVVGTDGEEIDPDAPYRAGYFYRYFYATSEETAINGYINFCIPDASRLAYVERWDLARKPSTIPGTLGHLIEDYRNLVPRREECQAGQEECTENVRFVGKCEAQSKDIAKFRYGNGAWAPIPDGKSDKVYREFSSGCRQDEGRIQVRDDWVTLSWRSLFPLSDSSNRACSSEERAAIVAEFGEQEGQLRCIQSRLICAQESQ